MQHRDRTEIDRFGRKRDGNFRLARQGIDPDKIAAVKAIGPEPRRFNYGETGGQHDDYCDSKDLREPPAGEARRRRSDQQDEQRYRHTMIGTRARHQLGGKQEVCSQNDCQRRNQAVR